MKVLRKLIIADISAVDRPANKFARAVIMKRDDGDTMDRFEKKAQADQAWRDGLAGYAKRNGLTIARACQEFYGTIEGQRLAKNCNAAGLQQNEIAKVAAVGNVTSETLSKAAFPDLAPSAAMVAWLGTEDGRAFYADDVSARTRAQQGF